MQPFHSIRVIDFTHVIAGPFCTYQLAVLGADVIKIESPREPDMVRQDGACVEQNARGMGSMFSAQNANKRSLALDLKSDRGRDIARDLIRGADVVVENYRSGAMASLSLGYRDAQALNPGLIYCSLTGFGQTGPKARHTAYDNVIQAFSGLMASTGDTDTAPVRVGPPVLDYGTGTQAAYAIAAALFQRTQTNEGQYIDIAMLDSALMLMSANITHYHTAGELLPPSGNDSPSKPGYSCHPTADGLLMIGAYTTRQHADMWRVLGDEQRARVMDTTTLTDMSQRYDEDIQALRAILKADTADHWETQLNIAKVPASRVRKLDETLAHAQIASRSVLQESPDTDGSPPLPVAAFCYHSGGPAVHSPPPLHGEHTRAILAELGYNDEELDALQVSGVVGFP